MPIAGGTDLMPNMKHRLFTPGHLVALNRIAALRGIDVVPVGNGPVRARSSDNRSPADGRGSLANDVGESGKSLRIGALEVLADVASSPLVRQHFPALATAAGLVAGPQLRNMGTIGGNICLDTRCTYYNQTEFWRGALGYCLKKDGAVCHVTRVGKKCVAAHSADTPPVLIALGATLALAGPGGAREIPAHDYFVADGIRNTRRTHGEILTEVRLPLAGPHRRSAYRKLRQRGSIDFPLLSVAVVGDMDETGVVARIRGVVSALGARPRLLSGWEAIAVGNRLDNRLINALAERAHAQCRPLENMIVDSQWRRAMVPVQVRRALREMAGPCAHPNAHGTHGSLRQSVTANQT